MWFSKRLKYLYLIFTNILSSTDDSFKRRLEPFSITAESAFVDDYNRASNSIMMLPYVLVLQTIQRILGPTGINQAVDLCCGPGHFTRLLAKQIEVKKVVGVDLSLPMLEYARENAILEQISEKMLFIKSDVAKLDSLPSASVDVTTLLNGAHHFDTIDDVMKVLLEAERITRPEGLILVLDPVRQKNKKISDSYHALTGEDYVRKGMFYFNLDFYNSLLASWTTEEFFQAIPKESSREWVQLVPFGLPSFQMLIGLPQGRKKIFEHKGMPRSDIKSLIPKESLLEWYIFNFTFVFARVKSLKNIAKLGPV